MTTMKKTVTLEPGETKRVVFSFTPETPGTYAVSVDGLSGLFDVLEAMTFSIMIFNPPAGTRYWVTKDGIFGLDKAWWYQGPFVSSYDIAITFLDENYNCPSGDPGCDGVECTIHPENGKSYSLNVATCELTEGPPPPPPPPPGDTPYLVEINLPESVQAGVEFPLRTVWFLPDPWENRTPKYIMWVYDYDGEDYTYLAMLDAYPLACQPLPDGSSKPTVWLDRPDATYEINSIAKVNRPGIYHIKAAVRASRMVGECETTVPQVWYEFEVGDLEVV